MSRLSRFIHFYTDEDDGNGGEKGILKTVTGTLLHITDALAKPAKKFTATLEPIQDLHGQDAPYPSGGGKNKFICYDNLTITPNGVTCTFIGHSVTLVGTATANISLNLTFGQTTNVGAELESGATYTWSAKTEGTIPNTINIYGGHLGTSTAQVGPFNPSGSTSKAIPSEGTYYDRVWMQIHEGEVFNGTLYIQTEKGSSKTAFSPYSNICPITGHTGANVVRTGKNLVDISNVGHNSYNIGGIQNLLKPSTKYTYSINGSVTDYSYSLYLASSGTNYNTTTRRLSAGYIGTGDSSTFTTPADMNEQWLILAGSRVLAGDVSINDILPQIEIGEVKSDYEPFNSTTIPITFPDAAGTVYGGTLTNEDGKWKLEVDWTSIDLGTKTFTKGNRNTDDTGYIFHFRDTTIKNNSELLCSQFKVVKGIPNWEALPVNCCNSAYSSYMVFCADYNDAATFKTAMSGVQLVYELNTPIEYTLTESQALTLLKGTNNVWCDASDDLELQYYAKAEETP